MSDCTCVVEMRECHHALTTEDEARIERCLTRAGHPKPKPVVLHVSTIGPRADTACTGHMLCECPRCTMQRATLVAAGPRRHASRPWQALHRAA